MKCFPSEYKSAILYMKPKRQKLIPRWGLFYSIKITQLTQQSITLLFLSVWMRVILPPALLRLRFTTILIGTTILPKPKDWNSEHFVLENYKKGCVDLSFKSQLVLTWLPWVHLEAPDTLSGICWLLGLTLPANQELSLERLLVYDLQSEIWSLHNMNPMKKISLSFDLFKVKSSNLFFFNCLEGKKVTYIFTYKELLSSKSRTIFTILNSGSKVH